MKITDYNAIAAEVVRQMPEKCPDLPAKIGQDNAVWCVMGIYLTNDQTSGYGQDFDISGFQDGHQRKPKLSVISSPTRVSVIDVNQMSYYQDRISICGYEDLEEDIAAILIYIQAAFDRIASR